jgi:hypothetical protein
VTPLAWYSAIAGGLRSPSAQGDGRTQRAPTRSARMGSTARPVETLKPGGCASCRAWRLYAGRGSALQA